MIIISQRKANKARKNAEANSSLFPVDKLYPYFDQKDAYIDKNEDGFIVVHDKVIVEATKPRKKTPKPVRKKSS